MQRLSKIETEDATGGLANFYEAVTAALGRVPNSYRTMANSPWLAMCLLPLNSVVQRQWPGTSVDGRTKELAVIKTSHINGCKYCYAHNTALGEAAGITHEEIIELSSDDYQQSESLSASEIVAVRWAAAVTTNTAAQDDALFAELQGHFNEQEIVELTMVTAMFNMINRINDSLRVPLEEMEEVNHIKRTLDLDPAKVKTYLTWLADTWPEDDFDTLVKEAKAAAKPPAQAAE